MTYKTMLRFRIWNGRLKVMIKGYKEAKKFFHGFCNDPEDERNLGLSFWKISDDYYKILKSTGLKDKKGVEIFEGDVVKTEDKEQNREWIDVVDWSDMEEYVDSAKFELRFREGWYLDELEVIGNIYENPELLKEVNK